MMFIRSESLFLRPAWPEDLGGLRAIDMPMELVSLAPGAQCGGDSYGLVVTVPCSAGRIIGAAALSRAADGWFRSFWLAPGMRCAKLHAEVERALAMLAQMLPGSSGGLTMQDAPGRIAA